MTRSSLSLVALLALSLLPFLAAGHLAAEQAAVPGWITSLDELRRAQFAEPRPALVYLVSGRSTREAELEPVWLAAAAAGQLGHHHVARLSVRVPEHRDYAAREEIIRVPALLVLDASGRPAARLGAAELTPEHLASRLASLSAAVATPPATAPAATPGALQAATPAAATVEGRLARIESVGRFGDGRATLPDGRPLYILGTGEADLGRTVAFRDVRDRGTYCEARLDTEVTALDPSPEANATALSVPTAQDPFAAGRDAGAGGGTAAPVAAIALPVGR